MDKNNIKIPLKVKNIGQLSTGKIILKTRKIMLHND